MRLTSKRSASGSSPAGGGRLRLGLLIAALAAFCLVPAASAMAATGDAHLTLEGSGSGEVVDDNTENPNNPPVDCHWNGATEEQTGACDVEAHNTGSGSWVFQVKEHAAGGSQFAGWTVEEGIPTTSAYCTATSERCYLLAFSGEFKVKAKFEAAAAPAENPLTLTSSGEGSGSFECEDLTAATAAAPCASGDEFPEGDEVKVIPVAASGSEFAEFNAENGGECSGATCTVTMDAAHSVNAKFDLEPSANVHITIEGTGSGAVVDAGEEAQRGTPPVDCHWDGTSEELTGDCDVEAGTSPFGSLIKVKRETASGSAFTGWTVEEGTVPFPEACEPQGESCTVLLGSGEIKIKAAFGPETPHPLHLIKEGSSEGWVISEDPAHAINCGTSCSERTAEFEGTVILHAYGPRFFGWGATECASKPSPRECEVTELGEAEKTVHAKFTKNALHLVKEGSGEAWVNTFGLNCGSSCSEQTAYYPSTNSRTLKAYGPSFAGWSGCDTEPSARECHVSLSTDKDVHAMFTKSKVTLVKNGLSESWVISEDPAHAINCGTSCEQRSGYFAEGDVTLHAYGSTFTGWQAGDCDAEPSPRECVLHVTSPNEERTVEVEF